MPSKSKKQSKSTLIHSKLSYSDQSPSSRTPLSSSSNPNYSIEEEEEEAVSEETLRQSLEQASTKFPSLISIGETAPFIGQLTSVVDNGKSRAGCTIWISEPAMNRASLVPGSTVSVSLASLRNNCSNIFPLSSLIDECARNIGIDTRDSMTNQAGNYFALATIFTSCKVLNNGVQLSSSLSYTMGSPTAGRYIFVNPIRNQQLAGNGFDKPLSDGVNCLSSHNCKELYLEFVPSENGLTTKTNMLFPPKSKETNNNVHKNQISSSPRTPLFQQKRFSSKSSELTPSISGSSTSNSQNYRKTSFDSVDIRQILGDESSRKLLQTCATSWLSSRSLLYGNLIAVPILLDICIFQVRGFNRALADNIIQDNVDHVDDAFVVDNETKVYLSLPFYLELEAPRNLPLFNFKHEDIKAKVSANISKLGGLSKEYATLKRIIISSIVKDPLSRFGVQPTKGVLLHGPPGTGKTTLARVCAHDAGVNVFSVNGPEIARQYDGESEKALHEVFESASQAAPAVVFIDELDAIAPARKDGGEEFSQRLVCTLLTIMDGICRTDGVFVIAATNRPDSIEPALRRPGRLDQEIEIGVPSPKQRLDILAKLLSQMKHSLSDAQVQQLALTTHGFVGADLVSLCKEANYVLLRKWHYAHSKDTDALLSRDHSDLGSSSKSDLPRMFERLALECTDIIQNGHSDRVNEMYELGDHMLIVTYEDFEKAKIKVKPSAMREVILEVPRVNWEDVGGQKEVKAQLKEAVEWPQKHPDVFERIGTSPPTGVLLFGPPGCSKTLMARAVASEAGFNFFSVKGPELFSKYVGESEKAVKSLFAKARANAPSIIFFDEIDGLAVIRGKEGDGVSVANRVMSQLLVEMDGFHQRVNVIVIAATNRPDKIDPALLRAGRFDRLLYVGLPNEIDREEIFRIHLRKSPCNSDVSLKELASLTEGFSGAEISLVRWKAAVAAIEESFDASEIKMKHLSNAIKQIQPSEIPSYQELSANFQRFVKLDTCTITRDGEKGQPRSIL